MSKRDEDICEGCGVGMQGGAQGIFGVCEVCREEPVIDPDEWELGPACGLDPEVCESCQ